MEGLIVKSDGSFFSHFGEMDLIKAETKEGVTAYHFAGVCSTPDKDREGEALLQEGLNFDNFNSSGEFNWNHVPHLLVGYPNGKGAYFDQGIWKAQGIIIPGLEVARGYNTDQIVQQHNQIKKAGLKKGLCMSVEGKVKERSLCGKYVKKAEIWNIALTFRPVNPNCTVELLAKSMDGKARIIENDDFYKSLGMGQIAPFVKQDIEGGTPRQKIKRKLKQNMLEKGYSDREAEYFVEAFLNTNPNIGE